MRWIPKEVWKGEDVFVIGGGDSLSRFDWTLLQYEFTIGCNDIYELGPSICKICLCCDTGALVEHEKGLREYGNPVFTNNRLYYIQDTGRNPKVSWLYTMLRKPKGLHRDALGWNLNTGASAINLALLLGAKRVFLIGFDMKMGSRFRWNGKKHAHTNTSATYTRFISAFDNVYRDWQAKFLDRDIVNVTDDSALNVFPKVGVKEFFKERSNG